MHRSSHSIRATDGPHSGHRRVSTNNSQAAAAGADVHGREGLRRCVDEGAQALLLAQGADAAQDVARGPLDQGLVGHGRLLGPGGLGQVFEAEHGFDGDDGHDEFAAEVRAAERHYQQAGISSVPAVIINDRHLISGGQPPEVFEQALRQLAQAA